MSTSEAMTRTDLANILNEVLPFSFTEFRYYNGSVTVPNSTLVQAHSETFASGSWLILTTTEVASNGSSTANLGQNRIHKDNALVSAAKGQADMSITIPNFYVLQSANNTTIQLKIYQNTGNSQSQLWKFIAIRIGDKFAEPVETSHVQFTNSTYSAVVDAYKHDKTVTVTIKQTATVSLPKGSWTTLATLPNGYRPIAQIDCLIPDNNTSSVQNNSIQCRINTSGAVMVWAYSNGVTTNQALGCVTFVAS